MIRRWASSEGGSSELLKYGMKPAELIEESRRNVGESQPAADHLVDWFLDRVAHTDSAGTDSSGIGDPNASSSARN